MANLVVRNIENDVVKALKTRAGLHGISAEEEHRRILKTALFSSKKKSFEEVLRAIPNVGDDQDFKRHQESGGEDVFT